MNKNIAIVLLFFCLVFSACKKNIPGYTNDNNSFNAFLLNDSVAATDWAKFQLTENPDVISFYSGEIGHNYDFRNRTVLTGGNLLMSFQTRVVNKAADTLDVLVSNDFTGIYDSANVANATWKLMTNKFTFPDPLTPLNTFVNSGIGANYYTSITDSVLAGQPFYVAFRYGVTKQNNIE